MVIIGSGNGFSPLTNVKYFEFNQLMRVPVQLTHWGRVTHTCIGNLTIIGPDNALSPGRRQAITWTNAGLLLTGQQNSMKSQSKFTHFHSRKCIWKCRVGNIGHIVSAWCVYLIRCVTQGLPNFACQTSPSVKASYPFFSCSNCASCVEISRGCIVMVTYCNSLATDSIWGHSTCQVLESVPLVSKYWRYSLQRMPSVVAWKCVALPNRV